MPNIIPQSQAGSNDSPVGQTITILLDGEKLSAPVIQAPVTDGDVNIYCLKSAEEGKDLAKLINCGALLLDLIQDCVDVWPGR